jgi:hypothetical protein
MEEKLPANRSARNVQTTLRLPKSLYEQAKGFVSTGATPATTVNDFIVSALRAYTRLLERKNIDAAFAAMAEDSAYRKEAQLIADEFAPSDWEALNEESEKLEATHAAR